MKTIVRESGIPVSDMNFETRSAAGYEQRFSSIDTMSTNAMAMHGARFRNFKISKFTINPGNFYWQTSDTSIEGKFPGYERNERGLLVCKNNEEI